ncbi:MAG: Flp pilus assembly complex ATPase component TadA, partial [Planctomycetes bacterium]|nr:Flp pilus assembly complex ATPase component TadA [Planctomycetota bacterium]
MEDTRLGAILIESRIIREEDLERCLEIQTLASGNRPLGQILVDEMLIDQATLDNLLRIQQARRQRALGSVPVEPAHAGRFLEAAAAVGANELHLSEARLPLARVAGELVALDSERLAGPEVWQFVREYMGPHMLEDIADRRSVTKEFASIGLARGRITAFRHTDGIAVNVRIHPPEVRPLEELDLVGAVRDTLTACKGMILLTGESGSGMTETFASLLHATAAHGNRHILVLDDCIEYPEPSGDARVCMRRVGLHTTDYAAGLRAAMRQNPDAIFIGDASEPEAFHLALNAAESGKLVVAVVHGETTSSVIEHCLGLFPS